ncbi:MAG: acyl-CoA thioesterase [Elusimicrobiaceae bacterium]|jgi:acyl-CoA thioester hydrolase|nr:acyl-CoA thioesterase [Elusimicrobiaceae bacterium]MBT3955625.1 acyl-CoA thioesterase [Elusimicrobiaceae bacterium]MBT4008739.1 acyl-CoA thioesterase [Elusimicrobiaceae bacterium]MBT4402780.1 acyl-CoA thioesterase [Elusimicrobiaceae bacterium]MBT4439585.1 acyl-CoA thioesterase [Elusimicrobiaceae bacterium]
MIKKKIYYYDTDAQGIVNNGSYLDYMEEARTEYIEKECEINFQKLQYEQNVLFVVYKHEIEYKYPARFGETLNIECSILDISDIKIEVEYKFTNQEDKLTTKAKTVLVCVNKEGSPIMIPGDVKDKLSKQI